MDQDGTEPITLTTTGVVSAGVITIALVGHTYNYITNPAYRNNYDSFVSSAADVAVKTAEDTWNTVISLFSSEDKSSESGSSNDKKNNSDVQTYNGKKADKHGNELGPSGKPKIHTKEHSTQKGAKDAARNEGKGKPVKHTSTKKGKNHYHASDNEGKKEPNSTHHEYP